MCNCDKIATLNRYLDKRNSPDLSKEIMGEPSTVFYLGVSVHDMPKETLVKLVTWLSREYIERSSI